MGWRHNRYKSRPASKNRGGRIAWDELSRRASLMTPPRQVDLVWFDDSQDDGYWCARLNGPEVDGGHDYIEMDGLEVRDRKNNPHKYIEGHTAMTTPNTTGAQALSDEFITWVGAHFGPDADEQYIAKAIAAMPHPLATPEIPREIQAVLIGLDLKRLGYMASHSGKLSKDGRNLDNFESAIPLVSEYDHRAACEKIAALALSNREQAGAVATLEVWQYPNTEMRMEDLRLTDQGKALPFGKYTLDLAAPGAAIAAREQEALSVDCPHCWQKAGEPCIWPETREHNRDAPHNARKAAALASREEAPEVSAQRECGNSECGWKGTTDRMLGSVGPLCPDCGETTEATAPEQSTAPNAELLRGWKRYEKLRKLTPAAFSRLHIVNVTGGHSFDDLVDALPEPSTPVPALQDRSGDNEGGRYLPLRKTAAGKFTMPLYASQSEAIAKTAHQAVSEHELKKIEDALYRVKDESVWVRSAAIDEALALLKVFRRNLNFPSSAGEHVWLKCDNCGKDMRGHDRMGHCAGEVEAVASEHARGQEVNS
jgi:hypothetical protein